MRPEAILRTAYQCIRYHCGAKARVSILWQGCTSRLAAVPRKLSANFRIQTQDSLCPKGCVAPMPQARSRTYSSLNVRSPARLTCTSATTIKKNRTISSTRGLFQNAPLRNLPLLYYSLRELRGKPHREEMSTTASATASGHDGLLGEGMP